MRKFILFLFVFSFLACDSEPSLVKDGRKSYRRFLEKVLKDPGSLQIYSEKYVVDEENNTVTWTVDLGAKNSWGGMDRETFTFETGFMGIGLKVDGKSVNW